MATHREPPQIARPIPPLAFSLRNTSHSGRWNSRVGIHLGVSGTEHSVADGQFADLNRLNIASSHGTGPAITALTVNKPSSALFGASVDLFGDVDVAATRLQDLVHGAGKPAGEHVGPTFAADLPYT